MISCSLGIWMWVVLLLVLALALVHLLLLVLVLFHRVPWTSPIQAVVWKRKQNTSWSLGSTAVANDPRLHWCLLSRSFQLKQRLSQRFHLLQATSNCMTPKRVALALLSCSTLNQALLVFSPQQPRSQLSLAASTGHGSAFWWTRLHQPFLHSQQTQTYTASSKSGLALPRFTTKNWTMRNFVPVHVRNSSRKVGRQPKHWMELTMFAHDRVRFLGLSHLSGFEIHPSMHVSCLSHVTCTDWLRKGSCTWLKGLPILSAMPHITLFGKSRGSMAGNCLHVGNCMMT